MEIIKEHPVSACVFIRNNLVGAFCLLESMISLMPLVSEFIVLDFGSTDGTLEVLKGISSNNSKVKLFQTKLAERKDANQFATLANDLIDLATYDNVLYYQADEVWHPNLLTKMNNKLEEGKFDLSFWRIQFRENFQKIKWFPHVVHRVGKKKNFNFVGDGMNTNRYLEPEICSDYDKSWFPLWGATDPMAIPVTDMITDVSQIGAFIGNIKTRRELHLPFWHEDFQIEGMDGDSWLKKEALNENWYKDESPFKIPPLLAYHLGYAKYHHRRDLIKLLEENNTKGMIEQWTA